jgi:hypothetical protein
MFAIVQNGRMIQVIQPDTPFTVGDKTYSANFIRNSSPQEKLEAGVWEIIEGMRGDDRYYFISGPSYHVNEVNSTVEANYTATPKQLEDRLEVKEDGTPLYVQEYDPATESMVDTTVQVVSKGLKSQQIAQAKAAANSLLATTDWMIIRKVERNVDVPADVSAYRAAVIAECTRLVEAITATTSVDELAAVTSNWPK